MKTKLASHRNLVGYALILTILLVGCGGGGSSTPATPTGPVASTLSFSVQSAYQAFTIAGQNRTFTVTGTCSGTGSQTVAPMTTPATFEGVAGYSATETITMSFSNCTPASIAQSLTAYADSAYVPHGFNTGASSAAANYGVYLVAPTIPTLATVGGTGIIGTETEYTDSTKVTIYGTQQASYLIEADTSTTAIVNLIFKGYNASSVLLFTEQDRYRITSGGVISHLYDDIQYANGSTTHLVLTFN